MWSDAIAIRSRRVLTPSRGLKSFDISVGRLPAPVDDASVFPSFEESRHGSRTSWQVAPSMRRSHKRRRKQCSHDLSKKDSPCSNVKCSTCLSV